MRRLIKYLNDLIFGVNVPILPFVEIESLLLITILNVNYLKAHISTSSALMNSYPARSIKRKQAVKFIENLQKRLSEQEYDKDMYCRMLKKNNVRSESADS